MTVDNITHRIFQGLGLVMGGKAAAGLVSLLYLIIAARALGPHEYGLLVLMHGYVTTVVGIVEFPAWQAIVRYGAEARAGNDVHRLARLLRFGAIIELTGGTAAALTAMALAPIVGPHLGWPPELIDFAILYSLAVLGSVRSVPAGYLQLIGRFDLIGLHNVVQPITRLAGATAAWLLGFGLRGFLFAWLAAALSEFAVLWIMGAVCAHRRLGQALARPEPGSATTENPGIWRFLVASNADLTLSELAGRIAPLIVGWVLGPAAAGLYAIAQRATVIIAQPAQILGNTSYSGLAALLASRQGGAALRHTLSRVIGIALLAAAPVILLVAAFPTPIVILLGGKAFAAAGSIMVMLVLARAITIIGPPCSSALSVMGYPALSMSANLFASMIFLPLFPWLLHQWGLTGAGALALGQSLIASTLLAGLAWRRSYQI